MARRKRVAHRETGRQTDTHTHVFMPAAGAADEALAVRLHHVKTEAGAETARLRDEVASIKDMYRDTLDRADQERHNLTQQIKEVSVRASVSLDLPSEAFCLCACAHVSTFHVSCTRPLDGSTD